MGKPSAPMCGGRASRAASGGEHGGAAQQKLDLLSTSQRGELPMFPLWHQIRGSIVVSISACHAEDPGSISGRGVFSFKPCGMQVTADQCNDQRGAGREARGAARGVARCGAARRGAARGVTSSDGLPSPLALDPGLVSPLSLSRPPCNRFPIVAWHT
jgi:hypothetical protein